MTQPQTPVYGLPYEKFRGDEPGRTLNSGSSGTSPILAEEVEDELARVDNDVADLQSRTATLEANPVPGWVPIRRGTGDGTTFLIDNIPTGVYDRLRLTLFGSVDTAGTIRLRINGDATTDLHRYGILVHDAAGALDVSNWDDEEFWHIAQWGTALTNTAQVEMWPTDVFETVCFEGHGMRVGGSATTHQTSRSWGRLNNPRLIDSIRVSGPAATAFNGTVRWWLEGFAP